MVVMVASSAVGGIAFFSACKSPTQILLDVRTNADCNNSAAWHGVAVYVGAPGIDVESRAATLSTNNCGAGGEIGTLYVTPSGAKDEEVGIRVVAGITTDPESCASQNYQGCIVARRAVRFSPSDTVNVVVDLQTQCTGVACDSSRTCLNGTCVDAREGNVESAATNPEAGISALDQDGATEGGAELPVRCGSVRCPANDSSNVCCLTIDVDAGTSSGVCKSGQDWTGPGTAKMFCDDDSDCAAFGGDAGMYVCCVAGTAGSGACQTHDVTGSQCVDEQTCAGATNAWLELCENGLCGGPGLCLGSSVVPGYQSCCAMP
jgi:hypothetical protein